MYVASLLRSFLLLHLIPVHVTSFVAPTRIRTSLSHGVVSITSAIIPGLTTPSDTKKTASQIGSSSSDKGNDTFGEGKSNREDDGVDWELEETLLAIHLRPLPGKSLDECLQRVSSYTQSFPFAAVLPVQPLQYLPAKDGGVDLKFLRKKTDIKSGIDGGIRFFVREKLEVEASQDEDDTDEDEDEDKDKSDAFFPTNGIEIIAKRNSRGQTIPKMFAEKLVIQAFVKGVTDGGNVEDSSATGSITSSSAGTPKTRFESPTKDMVALESVFHKWMDVGR
ncbi:hypothetical protein IV203_026187 [Nitzschia inconspicua]|uniref:Uncharacterized protein n=1 Tax=Nitzschia inconspicua TaxID=303405 RepID=A0A9K3LIV6_9STRA|nr:hypothetical protein IV203_026187 [Nitzschia inconspicua]